MPDIRAPGLLSLGSLTLYLASSNPGKLREFLEAAREGGISVELLPCIQNLPACLEDGRTFEENARKKALHYSRYMDGFVISDDSGISVDALRGAPGVRSARFAGAQADDQANNLKLLDELRRIEALQEEGMQKFEPAIRAAHYSCVIAIARRGSILAAVEGRADGLILKAPRGTSGFGYDPLFYYPPLSKTFAELSPQEKFSVSHRGVAFRKLLDYLQANQNDP